MIISEMFAEKIWSISVFQDKHAWFLCDIYLAKIKETSMHIYTYIEALELFALMDVCNLYKL